MKAEVIENPALYTIKNVRPGQAREGRVLGFLLRQSALAIVRSIILD